MDERKRADLSRYRFGRAKEEADISRHLSALGNFNKSANSSCYAIFHALRAVTALDGFDSKKHKGIISYFNQHYVKTKIFPADVSGIIDDAFNVRGNADYEDYYEVSPEEAQEQISNAEYIISIIQPYLESCWAEIEQEDKS